MRTTLPRFTTALLAVFLAATPARADPSPAFAEGQQALAQGKVEAARQIWEAAAARNEQAAYPLLVRLYEDGPERDLAEAFKWAWIGLSRTWDPAFRKDANDNYDRLQNSALRYQRQEGRARADQWLETHPLPATNH